MFWPHLLRPPVDDELDDDDDELDELEPVGRRPRHVLRSVDVTMVRVGRNTSNP